MRLHRSSRIDSRKSRRSVAAVLILFPALAWAQIDHASDLVSHEDFLEVRIQVSGADLDRLFANLGDGLSARMEYAIRLLDPRDRPWRVLGSRVLHEFRVAYELAWDPYRERFAVSTQDGRRLTFADETSVRDFFFRLDGYRIPWAAIDDGSRRAASRPLIVETRAVYEPIVFVTGLTILSILMPHTRQQTPWERLEREVRR